MYRTSLTDRWGSDKHVRLSGRVATTVNENSTVQTEPSTAVDAEWQILPALPWEGDLNELDVNDGAPPHWMSRFVSGRDSQARSTWKRCS